MCLSNIIQMCCLLDNEHVSNEGLFKQTHIKSSSDYQFNCFRN